MHDAAIRLRELDVFLLDTNSLSDAIATRPNAGVRRWLTDNDTTELFLRDHDR